MFGHDDEFTEGRGVRVLRLESHKGKRVGPSGLDQPLWNKLISGEYGVTGNVGHVRLDPCEDRHLPPLHNLIP